MILFCFIFFFFFIFTSDPYVPPWLIRNDFAHTKSLLIESVRTFIVRSSNTVTINGRNHVIVLAFIMALPNKICTPPLAGQNMLLELEGSAKWYRSTPQFSVSSVFLTHIYNHFSQAHATPIATMNQFALHSQFNTLGVGIHYIMDRGVQPVWKILTLPWPRFTTLPRQHWLVLDL